MRPAFRIEVDGADASALIRDRLVSLEIVDEAGVRSDTCDLVVDDRAPHVEMPRTGARLTVALGYQETGLVPMGTYVADEVRLGFPPARLSVRARAADMHGHQISVPRRRTWHDTTVGEVVAQIAADSGVDVRVAAELAGLPVAHLDQVAESDLSVLTRLGERHDAIAKPADGALVFARRGAAQAASGTVLEEIMLRPRDCASWSVEWSDRGSRYTGVQAGWHDLDGGQSRLELAGSDSGPVLMMRRIFPDGAAAAAAAAARLADLQRGKGRLSLQIPGDPRIAAETPLRLVDFRGGVGGEWVVTRATHRLDAGYVTSLEAMARAA